MRDITFIWATMVNINTITCTFVVVNRYSFTATSSILKQIIEVIFYHTHTWMYQQIVRSITVCGDVECRDWEVFHLISCLIQTMNHPIYYLLSMIMWSTCYFALVKCYYNFISNLKGHIPYVPFELTDAMGVLPLRGCTWSPEKYLHIDSISLLSYFHLNFKLTIPFVSLTLFWSQTFSETFIKCDYIKALYINKLK